MKYYKKGSALVTALWISVILSIIGIAFLTFIGNDYFFAGHQHSSMSAFYLARAGMELYSVEGSTGTFQISGPSHICTITTSGSDCVFTGTLNDSFGNTLGRRTIVAPCSNLKNWYETTR